MSNWAKKLQSSKKKDTKLPRNSPGPQTAPAETYNANEVLSALSARYDQIVAAAKADKLGEKVRIYRSLDLSSSWTTKGGNNGKSKRDDDYNLLFEVNRSIHLQRHGK